MYENESFRLWKKDGDGKIIADRIESIAPESVKKQLMEDFQRTYEAGQRIERVKKLWEENQIKNSTGVKS